MIAYCCSTNQEALQVECWQVHFEPAKWYKSPTGLKWPYCWQTEKIVACRQRRRPRISPSTSQSGTFWYSRHVFPITAEQLIGQTIRKTRILKLTHRTRTCWWSRASIVTQLSGNTRTDRTQRERDRNHLVHVNCDSCLFKYCVFCLQCAFFMCRVW